MTRGRSFIAVALTAFLVVGAAACGSGDGDKTAAGEAGTGGAATGGTPRATHATGPATEVCAALPQLEEAVGLLTMSEQVTSPDVGAELSQAHQTFAAFEPDVEVAADWENVEGILKTLAAAYDGVSMTDEKQMDAAQAKLEAEGEEFMVRLLTVGGSSEKVINHVQKKCGQGGGDLITDPCEFLTAADLAKVFPAEIPDPSSVNFGGGTLDCNWEIDNDSIKDDDFQVGVGMMPLADLQSQFTDQLTSLGAVTGLENGQSYQGTFGPLRASGTGHSVTFTHGDSGVVVSVQKGNNSSAKTDLGLATEFAKKIASQL